MENNGYCTKDFVMHNICKFTTFKNAQIHCACIIWGLSPMQIYNSRIILLIYLIIINLEYGNVCDRWYMTRILAHFEQKCLKNIFNCFLFFFTIYILLINSKISVRLGSPLHKLKEKIQLHI